MIRPLITYATAAVALLATSLSAASASNVDSAPDRERLLRQHVEYLAHDDRGGRMTGTDGERESARYLAQQLEQLGARPYSDDFIVPFEFTAGSQDTGSSIVVERGELTDQFTGKDTVQALAFSDTGTVEGEVVFAGYGIRVPEGQDFGYDSYATLDVEDKIVVVLRYSPEDAEGDVRATLARYSGPRFKAMTARQLGAKALIMVTGPRSANAGEVMPMTFDTAIAGSGIVAASISAEASAALFAGQGSLEELQRELDGANPHVAGKRLDGVTVTLDVKLERERSTGHNVLGVLPATRSPARTPAVAIGAHFDHLGTGQGGNSLARGDESDAVHNGADDNASGTAAVLEIARALADRERERDLVVAFWSGEELGLLGANAFVNALDDPTASLQAYVNFDMVGRARENKLSAQAVGSSSEWPGILERANFPVGWNLQLQEDPYLPTDSAAFNGSGIPTLNFFTGSHGDYHRPSDDVEAIAFGELTRVTELGERVVASLLSRDEPLPFQKVEPKQRGGGDRETVRAYTGTIPDYATEVEGLLLGGVVAGGPAEEAGLQKGDVIVQFGKQTIANIYDYTYALDAVKIDEPLEVVYVRDGERKTTTLVPRARD